MTEQERYRDLAMRLVSKALSGTNAEGPELGDAARAEWDKTMEAWDANAKVATALIGDDEGFKVQVGFNDPDGRSSKYVYKSAGELLSEDMRLINLAVAQTAAEKELREAMDAEREASELAEALEAEKAEERKVEFERVRELVRTAHVEELMRETDKSREEVVASQGHVNVVTVDPWAEREGG